MRYVHLTVLFALLGSTTASAADPLPMREIWSDSGKGDAGRFVDQPLFIEGGKQVAVFADGGTRSRSLFRRLNSETGRVDGAARQLPYDVSSVVGVSTDHELLAAYNNRSLSVWSPDGRPKMTPVKAFDRIDYLAFASRKHRLFAKTSPNDWCVIDWDRSRIEQVIRHVDSEAGGINADGTRVTTVSKKSIVIWSVETGERINETPVTGVGFDDRIELFASTGECFVLDVTGNRVARLLEEQERFIPVAVSDWGTGELFDHLSERNSHVSPDGRLIAWGVRNLKTGAAELRAVDLTGQRSWRQRWEHVDLGPFDVDWETRRIIVPIVRTDPITRARTQELRLLSFADE